MAKRKQKNAPAFKLSPKATAHLNKNLAAIREGIVNVCKMHTHDSDPSLTQEDFELLYIDYRRGVQEEGSGTRAAYRK